LGRDSLPSSGIALGAAFLIPAAISNTPQAAVCQELSVAEAKQIESF